MGPTLGAAAGGSGGRQDPFDELREELPFTELAPISVSDVRAALRKIRPSSGRGVDQVSALDLERLPDEAFQELVDLYSISESTGTWPWQLLLVLGHLLGKKGGGERVIGALSMFTRCWSMIREEAMREWSRLTAPIWDAAVEGNAALREAFARAVDEEAYVALGTTYGHGMMDVQQFYDSMSWTPLARAAQRSGFPPDVLALELQQCMACRVLLQEGMASQLISPPQSVVQGARSGTRVGRCMLYYTLRRIVLGSPKMPTPRSWVDDISLSAVGSGSAVVDQLSSSIVSFGHLL